MEVIHIGPDDVKKFTAEIEKNPSAFVRVYSPGCGYCDKMQPEWEKFMELLKSYNGNVGAFDIHSNALPKITTPALQSINGFPSILAINDIASKKTIPFEGPRTADEMLNFCVDNFNLEKKTDTLTGGKKTKRKSKRKSKKISKKSKKKSSKKSKRKSKKTNKKSSKKSKKKSRMSKKR
jgi:thiol-disulfide isomerase/thioredoxin